MPRYLIEVPHSDMECTQVVKIFLETGNHFMTHADWGCEDGEHYAWMIVELDSRDEALAILPPAFRHQAKIVRLVKFTYNEANEVTLRSHQGP